MPIGSHTLPRAASHGRQVRGARCAKWWAARRHPPSLALNPQLPRGFGAHSPSPRRRQQPPFPARWGHPAALLPVVTARGAGRRGAAPAGSDCGTCQMCMPRTRRGELCDLCGCGVWAGTKRAHTVYERRDTLTPGRELLAVCKQYLEVLATAQAGFLCRALCVSGAPSLRKDCRLRDGGESGA